MGSMAYAGFAPPETWDAVSDRDGIPFAQALAELLEAESDLPRRELGGRPHAYLEAHIEQGPRLEAEGQDIGVVSGIQGSRWFIVEISGKSDHAGTTPIAYRRDAVQDMLRAIAALNTLMHDPADICASPSPPSRSTPTPPTRWPAMSASPSTSATPTTPSSRPAATPSRA
jgi:N-carbamoyl-L-amino-acid hydrolase